MRNFARFSSAAAVLALLASAAQANEVNIYTYRETQLIQPLLDAFSKDTGIKVNVISASSGLEQRIRAEGANSPADVLLTVDIGRLQEAVEPASPSRSSRRRSRRPSPRSTAIRTATGTASRCARAWSTPPRTA